MATKKAKRAAALEKRERFLEAARQDGLQALQRAREHQEDRNKEIEKILSRRETALDQFFADSNARILSRLIHDARNYED